MSKKWEIFPKVPEKFIKKFPEYPPEILQLLYNRGINSRKKIETFLNPDYYRDLNNPFLLKDIKKAIRRIKKAIVKKELIAIFGDFDVDGVTSTVLLYQILTKLGAKVIHYIPQREEEGYGLNSLAIKRFALSGVNLLITVDCGISNRTEINLANSLGIDVIIIDHHLPPKKLPPAYAILNPKQKGDKYPFKNLAAVGLVFKLAQALLPNEEKFLKWQLDLVALATITDLMPLIDENRVLTKYGLIVLRKTKRIGLQYLYQSAGIQAEQIDPYLVGYVIGPRLNAAGRMETAELSFKLLNISDENEAQNLSIQLEELNKQRQLLLEKFINQAKEKIDSKKLLEKKLLLLVGEDWPAGIIGLIAGRLCDEYNRPTLILQKGDKDSRGSARSIEGFNIIEALENCSDLLIRYGGHKGAAGFTVNSNSIEELYERLIEFAEEKLTEEDLKQKIFIDMEIKFDQINWKLVENLKKFEPFGLGNPRPSFVSYDLQVKDVFIVGDGKHLKMRLSQNSREFMVIGFGFAQNYFQPKIGDRIDAVFYIDENIWNGNKSIELKLIDFKIKDK